jgi:serine/threonine protein kinase
MLSYQGEVKIIDFGIATAQVDDFRTTPGRFLGTVRYMSPEQVLLQPVDRRSDLYTIGAVLWEMLARRRLISKMPVHEMMEAIARQAPVFAAGGRAPSTARVWCRWWSKAWPKEPEQRFQSARELRDALLDATVELERWDQAQLAQLISREFAEEHRSLEAKLDQLRSGVTHELDPEHHAETKVNPLPDDVLQARTLDTDWAEALAPRLEAAETEVIAPLAFNTRVIPLRDELPGKRLTPVITTRPSPTPRPQTPGHRTRPAAGKARLPGGPLGERDLLGVGDGDGGGRAQPTRPNSGRRTAASNLDPGAEPRAPPQHQRQRRPPHLCR